MLKYLVTILLAVITITANAADEIILSSAARTTTTATTDIIKGVSYAGAKFTITVTSVTGGTTITPKVQGKARDGTYYDILILSAISSTGTTVFTVYPGIVPLTNQTASDILPLIYRVYVTHSSTGSYTYSITQSTVN